MTYYMVLPRGRRKYLYEYKSIRINGQPRSKFIAYHGPVNQTVVEMVHHDLEDPDTDIYRLHKYEQEKETVYVLDTETTGLGADHQVWGFSVNQCRFVRNELRIERSFSENAYPDRELTWAAREKTGMSRKKLEGNRPVREVFNDFREFMGKNPRVGGYNIEFDLRMLNSMRSPRGYSQIDVDRSVDGLDITRVLHPRAKNHTLKKTLKREKINPEGRLHDANVDARGTVELLEKQAKRIKAISRVKIEE